MLCFPYFYPCKAIDLSLAIVPTLLYGMPSRGKSLFNISFVVENNWESWHSTFLGTKTTMLPLCENEAPTPNGGEGVSPLNSAEGVPTQNVRGEHKEIINNMAP